MRRLALDFAPRPQSAGRGGWLAGALGVLLLCVAGSVWLPTGTVEASHMSEASVQPPLPDADAARAIDAAVRELNLPWIETCDALAGQFGASAAAALDALESDGRRGVLRLSGRAHSVASVQDLPARLRALPAIADVTLVGQETHGSGERPVRFVIELRWREGT